MPLSEIIESLKAHKEYLGVATSAIGIAKTAYDVIQARTRSSTRDRLLKRIQGLVAAQRAFSGLDSGGNHELVNIGRDIEWQISETLVDLGQASKAVRETRTTDGKLGLLQRVFLLYLPKGVKGWISHVICWLSEAMLCLMFLGTWVSDTTGELRQKGRGFRSLRHCRIGAVVGEGPFP